MKVLVTGATGFVASYLIPELQSHGHNVVLTSHSQKKIKIAGRSRPSIKANLSDLAQVRRLIRKTKPHAVVHLAGISLTKHSLYGAEEIAEVSVNKTRHLCLALTEVGRPVHFLYVSSGMVYGKAAENPRGASEKDVPQPTTRYGLGKLAAEHAVQTYGSDKFRFTIVRPFNHIGPGQSASFVCPALAIRIIKSENGSTIPVGSLNSVRDFTDVRDIVRAYRLILEKKPREALLVLGSGRQTKLKQVFDLLVSVSRKKLRYKVDQELSTSRKLPLMKSNPALARRVLGWKPKISLKQSLTDLYRYESARRAI